MLLLAFAAAAQTGTVAIGNNGSYVLSESFTFLEDPGNQLTLEDILRPDLQPRFKSVAHGPQSTNFGGTSSAIWLRVVLQPGSDAPAQWLLEVAYPPLDQLDLYVSNSRGGFDRQSGGDSLPFPERPIPHRNHVKPIVLQPGVASVMYLRIASEGAVSAPTTLWQPTALWQNDQKHYAVFGLYFGLLIGLLAYNLLLFLSVRDTAYLIYVVFVAFIGLSQAANSGLGAQFLWPNALWWNIHSINTMHAASGAFAMLFVRSFLASRSKMPKADLWLRVLFGSWMVTVLASLVMSYKLASNMTSVLALLSVVTILVMAVISIRRNHPGSKSFGLAWGALLIGVVTQVAHNHGYLPSNPFTVDALLIGSALEMVLLSFALADRINVARREKELAQAQVAAEQTVVQALEQSQERYRSVIEHVAEGMVVVQNDSIVFVNSRATEILESTKADITKDGIFSKIHVEDHEMLATRMRRRLANREVPERCQARIALPGQPVKWLEFGDNLVPWDGGQGLLVFFLDVTARHNAELETQAALNRQQELNELRSRFVAMTSHEFRTPLAAILSAQDLLKSYGGRLAESEKSELLGMIASSVNRMTGMLERVLLLGQVEAHMLEFKPRQLDLAALCQELVTEATNQQPASQCRVVADLSHSPGMGLYDEKLLRHIFSNLLSNAIKYSPDGGEVRMKVFAEGAQTVFEVSDQGIGIPADEIHHLFESFHRASNVGSIQGTGLGLAIVKQSVDLHGGTINVASHAGQGACFTVRLG